MVFLVLGLPKVVRIKQNYQSGTQTHFRHMGTGSSANKISGICQVLRSSKKPGGLSEQFAINVPQKRFFHVDSAY